jgi:hypothetical protein
MHQPTNCVDHHYQEAPLPSTRQISSWAFRFLGHRHHSGYNQVRFYQHCHSALATHRGGRVSCRTHAHALQCFWTASLSALLTDLVLSL